MYFGFVIKNIFIPSTTTTSDTNAYDIIFSLSFFNKFFNCCICKFHYFGGLLWPIIGLGVQFSIAFLIASSAKTEQWSLIGGNWRASAISLSLICFASVIVLPLSISTKRVDHAIAEPHPYVFNLT